MERRKTDIQNPEKYFDFAVPQKSVENFRLEKLNEIKNNVWDL